MGTSIVALFAANAVILAVMALAFYAAWLGRRQERYWVSWIVANLVLAAAMMCFLLLPAERPGITLVLANSLMVLGLGFRWRAARQFGGRASPLGPVVIPALFTAGLFAVPGVVDQGLRFILINALCAVQGAATCYEFFRDRQDRLPSRYGLIVVYGGLALGFALRVSQSPLFGMPVAGYLPQDVLLLAGVFAGLFHAVGSGAFALSIAYERGASALRAAALRDPLTGIFNRRAFERQLQQHLAGDAPFAVVFLDIDRFKEVNDRYGHTAGDTALRVCADTIVHALRTSDFVARIGGEEFAAILPGLSAAEAFDVVERVRSAIEAREIVSHDHRFSVTLSGDVAHSAHRLDDMGKLMKAADAGLYRAKQAGRNRIVQAA